MKLLELYALESDYFMVVLSGRDKPEGIYRLDVPNQGSIHYYQLLNTLCMGREILKDYSLSHILGISVDGLYHFICGIGKLVMTGDSDKGFDSVHNGFSDNEDFRGLFL